jgi:hypothetical protein
VAAAIERGLAHGRAPRRNATEMWGEPGERAHEWIERRGSQIDKPAGKKTRRNHSPERAVAENIDGPRPAGMAALDRVYLAPGDG